MLRVLVVVANLAIGAVWLGSMAYSLGVVQPRVAAFFDDDQRQEEFLTVLAHGNRWPVVGLVSVLLATGAAAIGLAPAGAAVGHAVSVLLYAAAAGIFWYVSWRHWPARLFALPAELPGHRRRLRRLALTMTALVGCGFVASAVAAVALA